MIDPQETGPPAVQPNDVEFYREIAWLRGCAALIRMSPLWPLWWPLLLACEAKADRRERDLLAPAPTQPEAPSATIIDFAEWRLRHRAARALAQRAL